MSDFWKTSISQVRPNEILVRGYPIDELASKRSFGDVVYLLLTGELPHAQQGRLIEMMLIVCCEHSLASPSADAVRFVASCGVPLQIAVAAGVSAIGDVHGGAIEPCARLLKRAVAQSLPPAAIYAELKSQNARLPGFGHPVHTRDPRVQVLLDTADGWSLSGAHTHLARQLEAESDNAVGKHLPLNVDGAIAALMCDMNIDPALGKAFFIIGRSPGYVTHAHEQMTRERPFKAANIDDITYTGPAKRPVPPAHADPLSP
jgi:citrate synthase